MSTPILIKADKQPLYEFFNFIIALWGTYFTYIPLGLDVRKIASISNQTFNLWTIYCTLCIIKRISGSSSKSLSRWINTTHQITASLSFMIFCFYWPFLSRADLLISVMQRPEPLRLGEIYNSVLKHIYLPLNIWFELFSHTFDYDSNYKKLMINSIIYLVFCLFVSTNILGVRVYDIFDFFKISGYIYLLLSIALTILGFYLSFNINKRLKELVKIKENNEKKKKVK